MRAKAQHGPWAGTWPQGWRVVRLADTGRWLSGGTPNTSNDDYWGGEIPWISAASLKSFSIATSDRTVTELGALSGTRLLSKDAVLFVVRGMSLNNEFRIGVTERRMAFGQDCKAIIAADHIDPTFLAHAIKAQSARILGMVETTSHGTGRLDSKRLGELEIGIPPLDQQLRIVAVIAAVTRNIEALGRRIDKLRVIDNDLCLRATRSGFNGSLIELRPLKDVATVAAGVTLGAEASGHNSIRLPYLRVANVQDGRIDICDLKHVRILKSQLDRFLLKAGDLLLTEGGDLDKLGRGAVWDGRVSPCLHQNHVFRVRCGAALLPDYLSLYTASVEGRRYFMSVGKQSTNLASINSTQVRNMPIPVPPVEQQKRALAPVLAVRRRMRLLQARVGKLKVIRGALAEDLLTGRIKVGMSDDL